MNDLTKKLQDKNYVRAFGLMTPEEQECFREAKRNNCLVYYDVGGWNEGSSGTFQGSYTYAIKPDYQPEPEYVDLEIKEGKLKNNIECLNNIKLLGLFDGDCPFELPYYFTIISDLPSLLNFQSFRRELKTHCDLMEVSTIISEGKKVYARFRRD